MSSNLLDELVRKSEELRREEVTTLPASGMRVRLRGLMTEELQRVGITPPERQLFVQMALSWVDDAGNLVMNANSLDDLRKFGKLHGDDTVHAANIISRISGRGAEAEELGKENSSAETTEKRESGSFSPSPSPSPHLSAA